MMIDGRLVSPINAMILLSVIHQSRFFVLVLGRMCGMVRPSASSVVNILLSFVQVMSTCGKNIVAWESAAVCGFDMCDGDDRSSTMRDTNRSSTIVQ